MTSQGHEFQRELFSRFDAALAKGEDWVEIHCGHLHDTVRERLGFTNSRHATCSGVMWRETAAGNCQVVSSPRFGNGAELTINFGLPREPFTPVLTNKRQFAQRRVTALPAVIGKGRTLGKGPAVLRLESDREIHNFSLSEEHAKQLSDQFHHWAKP